MNSKLIKMSPPSYRRIYEALRQKAIKAGPAGVLAPSYSVLSKEFNVGPSTVVRAINLLKQDGWAYGQQGKGTYLCQQAVSSKISTIIFITPSLDVDTVAYSRAIAKKLDHSRYHLSICSTHANLKQYQHLIRQVSDLKPAGVILISISPESCPINPLPLIESGIPVVVIGYYPIPGLACDRVVYKQQDSGREIARHILRNNWRKIGVVLSRSARNEREEFLETLRRELQTGGVKIPDERVFYVDMGHGYDAHPNPYIDVERYMTRLLADGFRCETLVMGYDYPAVGALRAVLNAGIKVPEQMRIISALRCAVDGATPMKLTTIDSNHWEQASLAAELLVRRINGYNGSPEVHYVRGQLIEGETT